MAQQQIEEEQALTPEEQSHLEDVIAQDDILDDRIKKRMED